MATWRVEVDNGRRWVEATSGEQWDADPTTGDELRAITGTPVPLAPMAETYTPTGKGDPVWLYLAARHILGGDVTVTGRPPKTPEGDPLAYPAGATP